jgi:hypothetical protein
MQFQQLIQENFSLFSIKLPQGIILSENISQRFKYYSPIDVCILCCRISTSESLFQEVLTFLINKVCLQCPHHSLFQIFALSNGNNVGVDQRNKRYLFERHTNYYKSNLFLMSLF